MSSLFLIIFNLYLCRTLQSFQSLQRIPTMGDSIYNAEGGFSLTMSICFSLADGGDSNPTAPLALQHRLTQVINSFNLGTPLDSEGD